MLAYRKPFDHYRYHQLKFKNSLALIYVYCPSVKHSTGRWCRPLFSFCLIYLVCNRFIGHKYCVHFDVYSRWHCGLPTIMRLISNMLATWNLLASRGIPQTTNNEQNQTKIPLNPLISQNDAYCFCGGFSIYNIIINFHYSHIRTTDSVAFARSILISITNG